MTGSPSAVTRACLLLAAAAGAAYAFSPLSVIVAGAMFLLFGRVACDVHHAERRWVLGVLITGFALRAVAVIVLFVTTNPSREQVHTLFGDDHFSVLRSIWMLNAWQGTPIGAWYWFNTQTTYASPLFDRVLAAVQWFIGASPAALPSISIAFFFAGTALVYRLARRSFGPVAALVGLVILVYWPTFFVWSISMLKESAQFLLYAAAMTAAVAATRVERWGVRALLLTVVAAAAYLNVRLRVGSHLIVLTTVLFGYAVAASVRRSAIFVVVAASLLVAGALVARLPPVQKLARDNVYRAMLLHIGNVRTPGNFFFAADQRFYSDRNHFDHMRPPSFDESARFLVKSAAMFVLAPLPAHFLSSGTMAFIPQQIAWLLLILFACWGTWVGFRRDVLLTAMFLGHCLAVVAVIAPNSGNVGTLIRHRDVIVPFAVWLGGLGIAAALGTIGRTLHASH